jgi:hypothetical protein
MSGEIRTIRWKKIRRFDNIRENYCRDDLLINFSTDFRYFVDVDQQNK